MNQPTIEKSYERLSQIYEMPPYDEYVKELETSEGRQKAYERLSEEYDLPFDFQTFDYEVRQQLPRSILGQFVEGFKRSNVGLALMGKPESEAREPRTFAQGIATQAGVLAGDLPAMLLGSALAAPSRNPFVIAGTAFAAPEAIRQAQLEFMEKGTARPFLTGKDLSWATFKPASEYNPESIVGSLLKSAVAGAKGFAVGAATQAAGTVAPYGLKTAAEIATVATAPRVLEGELPTARDVAEAAVLVGGLKAATRVPKILKAPKREGVTKAKSAPPPEAPRPPRTYAEQFNEAVKIAESTILVTRGLDENVRYNRLKEALKDYDPIVSEEITEPRRERGGPIGREERAEVAVEPDEARRPFVNAIAEASVPVADLRAQIEAIKSELGKRRPASKVERESVAEEGAYGLELIGRGFEIFATPKKIPTFDFSHVPTDQLVQMLPALDERLRAVTKKLNDAKQLGRDPLINYFFENKAQNKPAAPLRGVTAAGEVVSIKINRIRSTDISRWKQIAEQLAPETEGTLTVSRPQPSTSTIDVELPSGIKEALNKDFSQSAYEEALPRLREAWKAYKMAGKRFVEFEADVKRELGGNAELYLTKYRKEIDSSDFVRILSEATLPGDKFVQLDASASAIWFLSPEQAARTAGRGFIHSTGKKAPVAVNLESPGVQDLVSFVIGSEGKALELIAQDISYVNRVRREAFASTTKKRVADPGRPILGLVTRKRFEKVDAEIVHAVKQRYLGGRKPTGVSDAAVNASAEIAALVRLLDNQLVEYTRTLARLKEKPDIIRGSLAKLVNLRNRAFGSANPKDFWNNLETYIAAHAKLTTVDVVAKAIKQYMRRAGSLAFPENLRRLIHEQIIDAKGRVWVGDRVADSIVKWFARSKLANKIGLTIDPGARPFSRIVGMARSGEVKLKLGYRPIAAIVNGLFAFYKPLVKADGSMIRTAREAMMWMKSPEGRALLEEETYHGSLGISVATDTSGKPIVKQSVFNPLGFWMAVEPPARRFNFAVAYLDALKRGMPEAAAKEFARRMVRLTNLTYVMSATPRIMRSPSAQVITQFKRFISGEFEFVHSLSPREWARYALFQSLLVGPRGALLFIKSIPFLAAVGLLDKIEEQIHKLRFAGGIPNLLNVDLGPAATLQLPTRPEDAFGLIVSDAIKFYKEVYSPAMNPELSAENKIKNAAERLPEFMIAAKNWLDLVEANVDEEGWVMDSEGNRLYRLDSDYEKFLVGVLGASTLEKSRIQSAQSIAARDDVRKDEALKILARRLRKEFALTGQISDSLIDDIVKLGVSDPEAIENILVTSKLPPDVRTALRVRLRDRSKVFELFNVIRDQSRAPALAEDQE